MKAASIEPNTSPIRKEGDNNYPEDINAEANST